MFTKAPSSLLAGRPHVLDSDGQVIPTLPRRLAMSCGASEPERQIMTDLFPMQLVPSILLFSVHCALSFSDASSMMRWLVLATKREPACPLENPLRLRVEEAMLTLTEENFVIASRFLQHGMFLATIMYECMGAPRFAGLCFMFYATFLVIAKGHIKMTAARVKGFVILNYITFLPVLFAGDLFAALGRPEVLDQLKMAYRFILVVLYVDGRLHLPAQFATSSLEVGKSRHVGATPNSLEVIWSSLPCPVRPVRSVRSVRSMQVAFYLWNRGWDEPAVPFVLLGCRVTLGRTVPGLGLRARDVFLSLFCKNLQVGKLEWGHSARSVSVLTVWGWARDEGCT